MKEQQIWECERTHSDKPKYPRLKISFWKLNKYLKNNSFMQNIYTHISVTIKRNSFINKSVHTAYYIITLFEFISLQKSINVSYFIYFDFVRWSKENGPVCDLHGSFDTSQRETTSIPDARNYR